MMHDLPEPIKLRVQLTGLNWLFELCPGRKETRLWIELGIICAAIVRHHENYSQKFFPRLNFLIAAVIEFFQANHGTRKRRIAECFGSLG
jgi:hypothetical protein